MFSQSFHLIEISDIRINYGEDKIALDLELKNKAFGILGSFTLPGYLTSFKFS